MDLKERQIVEALQNAAAHFQMTSLSCRQYNSYRSKYAPNTLSASTIIKLVGNWSIAIEMAGLHTGRRMLPRCTRCGKRYTRQNNQDAYCSSCHTIEQPTNPLSLVQYRQFSQTIILSALQEAANSENDPLTLSKYRRFVRKQASVRYPSSSTISNRFGSWEAALQAAGLKQLARTAQPSKSPYTNEQLLQFLRGAAAKVDGPLTTNKFYHLHQRPSVTVIRNRFGGWNKALQAAGLYTADMLKSKEDFLQNT